MAEAAAGRAASLVIALALCAPGGRPAAAEGATARPATAPPAAPARAPAGGATCLPSGNGYLRARLRGALDLDIDWHDAEMECDGGPRPDGSGIRVSIAGPRQSDGRRLRFVFGIARVREGQGGRALPTNLTVIFENEARLFATLGDDKCTIDELSQERLGALGGASRTWRVVGRGFCIAPAITPGSAARILVTRFDFAGAIGVDDAAAAGVAAAPAPASAP